MEISTKKDPVKFGDFEKNKTNPFLESGINEMVGGFVKKYRNSTGTDQRAVLKAFDPKTGEVLGNTAFVRQIEVDEAKFAKIYLANFSAFFELKPQAMRVFGYIMTKIIPGQDLISFFFEDCKDYTKYKNKQSIYDGLANLIDNGIIARGPSDAHFYINPLVVFNGNRVTYANTYIKKQKNNKPNNQIDLFSDNSIRNIEDFENRAGETV